MGTSAGMRRRRQLVTWVTAATAAAASIALAGCSTNPSGTQPGASTSAPTTGPGSSTTSTPAAPTTSSPPTSSVPPTTPPTTLPPAPILSLGSSGAAVLTLQQRLVTLHYWLGTPNGQFGDSTQQAVYALQKAAGIARDGAVGTATQQALAAGIEPHPRPTSGYAIEVDLSTDLLMFVTRGSLLWTLNTSTGGGYVYTGTAVADTPVGTFSFFREVDGLVTDSLGQLWRPKYFSGGFAVHGDSSVPPVPVSHGCVRVSNEAIDWIWTSNMAPLGTTVWVFT